MKLLEVNLKDGCIPFGGDINKLDIKKSIKEQWVHLSEDIVWIQYLFKEIELNISIDYCPTSGPLINPLGYFLIKINYVNNKYEKLDDLKFYF